MSQHTSTDLLQHIPKLMRRARRVSASRSEAEDLVQDTLLQMCRRLSAAADIDDLGAYAMQTLNNRARRRGTTIPTEELEDDMASSNPEALARLDCADVLAAIERLPEPQRVLLEFVIDGETSPAEMAKSLDLPLGTVMSRLARARARLRRALGETKDT